MAFKYLSTVVDTLHERVNDCFRGLLQIYQSFYHCPTVKIDISAVITMTVCCDKSATYAHVKRARNGQLTPVI